MKKERAITAKEFITALPVEVPDYYADMHEEELMAFCEVGFHNEEHYLVWQHLCAFQHVLADDIAATMKKQNLGVAV